MRSGLHDRVRQRREAGLSGFVLLAQALEAALGERRPLGQLQLVSSLRHGRSLGHGHLPLGRFCAFARFATKSDSSPR